MSRLRTLVPALAAVALALGATPALAQSEASRAKIGASVDDHSLYGQFLVGQDAMNRGESGGAATKAIVQLAIDHPNDDTLRDKAFTIAIQDALHHGSDSESAKLLIRAALNSRTDGVLRDHGFAAALVVGDVAAAARLAPGEDNPTLAFRGLGRLTKAVDAMADGRGGEADRLLSGPPVSFPNHVAILLLKPFAAAQAGAWDRAVGVHDAEGERLALLLDPYIRAQLLEMKGRYPEAEALYKSLVDDQVISSMFAQPYGEFLERRGRTAEAKAVYDTALAANPGDEGLAVAEQRLLRHGAPPALEMRRGASDALTYVAGSMAAQRQAELSLIYARLALRLDPDHGQAWVMCGDALALGHDEGQARACWAKVKPDDRFYADARSRMAYSLQREGDVEGALTITKELTTGDVYRRTQGDMVMAEILRTAGRYKEASDALDQVVTAGGDHDWRVLYLRAAVREQLGRWSEAEVDLTAALKMAPNEPDLLNFLGYQWVDRGENVQGGLDLVQRAVKARPNSGAMQDSLGWAYYRLGQYPKAVESLEAAVTLEPSDPAINDHLGDAYWMVGRRDEAGYQWRRTLTFQPDAVLKTSVETKLKSGLGPRAQVAGQ